MMKKKYCAAPLLLFMMVSVTLPGEAAITEKQLKKNNARMLEVLTRENPHHHRAIGHLLRLYIGEKRSGARLIDRLGIFLQDCRNNKVDIMRALFYARGKCFTLFFRLKDRNDGQLYLLFLRYPYTSRNKSCRLVDIAFGPDFKEKKETLKRLFNNQASPGKDNQLITPLIPDEETGTQNPPQ